MDVSSNAETPTPNTGATRRRQLATRLARAVGDIAPTLAGALGGPLAGAATDAVRDAIFGSDGSKSVADVETAILARDPATLAALRQAELDFRKAVLDSQLQAKSLANADRANARARQIALKDATPAVLGIAVISGFFGVLLVMLLRELPPSAETEFSIMIGALATMTAAVVNYFFGSSADSREKTQIMAGR